MAEKPVADLERYVDVEDALKRVCGNKNIYKKLLGTFEKSVSVEQLRGEVAAGDLETATRTAHTIKGVTANLSLKAAYEKSMQVEQDLKQGIVNEAAIGELDEILKTTLLCTAYVAETL